MLNCIRTPVLALMSIAAGAAADCPNGTHTTIVFGNGIGTARDEAHAILNNTLKPAIVDRLAAETDQSCLAFALAYDSTFVDSDNKIINAANQIAQIVDAMVQRNIDFAANFWKYMSFRIEPPQWFQDLQRTMITSATSIYQPDLIIHEALYNSEIALGHNIIVVAHSQGNLYVNQAYDVVTSLGGSNSFHVVAVATPAASVAGSGPHFTLYGDIITLVAVLSPNIRNGAPSPCLTGDSVACHSFESSYMDLQAGGNTRPAIVNAVLSKLPAPSSYTITDLGALPGGTDSCGQGINASGQITGYSTAITRADHAFLYSGGVLNDLGTLATTATSSIGTGINESGSVTGYSWTGTTQHAFLYTPANGMVDLGTLGGMSSFGRAINSQGQVVGESDVSGTQHAFLYESSKGMSDLGTLGGTISWGRGINDSGQATGGAGTGAGSLHAFLYTPGNGMVDLGTLGGNGDGSEGHAINASGQITGSAFVAATGESHAFLYTPGKGIEDLEALPGWTNNVGYGINAQGQVIGCGSANNVALRAFLYTPGKGMIDLNTVLPSGSGWTLTCGYGINDTGQITGVGANANGTSRAFLLTPVK